MNVNLRKFPSVKTTKQQMEDYVETQISRKYEAEDKNNDSVKLPYFMRATQEVKNIKNAGTLEKTYKEMKKGN